jgi:hypothetical protein
LLPRRCGSTPRVRIDVISVIPMTRDHMDVHMFDLLAGDLTVR